MSIYRELFVEVPQALLEAAVAEAQERAIAGLAHVYKQAYTPPRQPSFVDRLNQPDVRSWLCEAFGWLSYEVRRSQHDDSLEVVVTMSCGHRARRRLGEWAVWVWLERSGPAAAIDNLVAQLERQQHLRACYCVPRPLERSD